MTEEVANISRDMETPWRDVSPDPPLVSIVIPAFNRADYLPETIESVLCQDYPNIETIVLDDGSTDNTHEVLERYRGRLRALRHDNMGENRTVNRGLEETRGGIVCVVNSDDPLLPEAVSVAVEYLRNHPDVLAAYPNWVEIDANGHRLQTYELPQYNIYNMLLDFNVAMGPGVFIRRRALEMIGMRNANLRYTGDLDYWFRLSLRGPLGHIPRVLATHRTHPGAASSSAKGRFMADELIRLADTTLASTYLPPNLYKNRHRIFAYAHAGALAYYGDNRQGDWRHRLFGIAHAVCSHDPEAWKVWTPNSLKWLYDRGRLINPVFCYRQVFLSRLRVIKRAILARSVQLVRGLIRLCWQTYCLLSPPATQVDRLRFAFVSNDLQFHGTLQAVVIGRLLGSISSDAYRLITQSNVRSGMASDSQTDFVLLPPEPGAGLWLRGGALGAGSVLLRVILRGCRIARQIRANGCSVAVASTGDLINLPATALACALTKVPFVAYIFDDFLNQWCLVPGVQRWARAMERVFIAKAAGVIVSNEALASEILRRHGVICSIIRKPGVSPSAVLKGTLADPIHVRSGFPLIAYRGSVNSLNNAAFRILISAMGRISKAPPCLDIYTDQDAAQLPTECLYGLGVRLRPYAELGTLGCNPWGADVLFMGYSFDSEVQAVVSTLAPLELGDYLASGRPILAMVPPDSFLAHYFRDHRCALVVDRDDPEALADEMNRLLHDPGLSASLVAHALECARAEFTPDEAARRFMLVLEGVR